MTPTINQWLLIFMPMVCVLSACELSVMDSQALATKSSLKPQATNIELWPKAVSPFKPDTELEDRIDGLLSRMTLDQKVAQMIQPEIRDFTVADMRRYGFGSFLNGGGAYPNNNKHAQIKDWVALAETLYQAALDDSVDGVAIPPMWGTDAVHGHNNVIGATLFPHNIGLGASGNPALIEQIATVTAKEVAATGIDWVFAPTVAVVRDDRWGRTYEGYSEDPQLVKEYAAAFVRGMQGELGRDWFNDGHVIATAKHFIGDGGTWQGDDQGDTRVSEAELSAIHGQGYEAAIAAGVQTIMVSFNSWWGQKNHGNHYLLTQVLKQRMGFDGVLVGDWNGHGQLPGCSIDSCPDAINAGLDIFMVPSDAWKPLYHNTIEQVETGEIAQDRINDAVRRILRVKFRAGLFDKPSPAQRPLASEQSLVGATEHRELARQAVRESLVLLKNNGQLLPLAASTNVMITGAAADNIGQQAGGWSVTWQGTDNLNSDFPGATSVYQGIKQHVIAAGGAVQLSADGSWTGSKPDVAIVVFGEEPYAEGNGDLANLEFQRGNKRDLALLRAIKAQHIPVVAVFITGRPMWVNPEINLADAFLVAWLPGTEAGGIADLIFKDAQGQVRYDFTGRLSFSWPDSPYQTDINGEQTTALFKLGYGLKLADNIELQQLNEVIEQAESAPPVLPLLDGVVKAPWKLWVGDGKQMQQVRSNNTLMPTVTLRDIDKVIQQDARRIIFSPAGRGVVRFQASFPLDLRSYGEFSSSIVMDVRRSVDEPSPLMLTIGCGAQCRRSTQVDIASVAEGQWQTFSINLACFELSSEQLANTFIPLELSGSGDWTLDIANVRWQRNEINASTKCHAYEK